MRPAYWQDEQVQLYLGDALEVLREMPGGSVNCCVTSPPYYHQRDYGTEGQIGLEDSPTAYVERLREVFAELRRVLADDGTLWLNIGDSYSGSWGNQSRDESSPGLVTATDGRFPAATRTGSIKPGQPAAKNLMGMPWRLAFTLQDDGWILRNDIVWHKPNAMPESVTDRLSTRWEHLFLLARSRRYYFDLDAIREPLARPEALTEGIVFGGRNGGEGKVDASARRSGGGGRSVYGQRRRTPQYSYDAPGAKNLNSGLHAAREEVAPDGHPLGRNPGDCWSFPTQPYPEAHFAVFPLELPVRCIKAGCKPGGTVLDPFSGSGTTGEACRRLGRKYTGIDLNPAYHDLAIKRYAQGVMDFGEAS